MTDIKQIVTNAVMDNSNDYLLVAAKYNHIELLNFITSLKEIDEDTYFTIFLNFCAYGHIESCMNFIDTKPFLRDRIDNNVLNIVVENNHLPIIELLYDVVRDVNDEMLCVKAITRGYLDISKWLYSKCDTIQLNNICPDLFWQGCISGNIDIVEWLLDILPCIDITDKYVCLACELGHLEMAKWLKDRNPTMTSVDDYTINKVISKGHDHIILWLAETFTELEVAMTAKAKLSDEELLRWAKENNMIAKV